MESSKLPLEHADDVYDYGYDDVPRRACVRAGEAGA
jgi:hypothetical protein